MSRGGAPEFVAGEVIVEFRAGAPAAAIERLSSHPSVEYAEPNWIYRHAATSNDTYFTNGSLWGMYGAKTSPANAFGSHAAASWAGGKSNCGTAWVGIIYEGRMYTHEDLQANAATNPGEIPGNGVDDDGNGYVDDVYGWDFDGNNNTVFDGTDDDHGTHVAGSSAATIKTAIMKSALPTASLSGKVVSNGRLDTSSF